MVAEKPVELTKTMKDFGEYLVYDEPHRLFGGRTLGFDFPNGYRASVVCFNGTYGHTQGLWELAICKDDRVVYDTPITNDVVGFLNDTGVDKLLRQIKEL